MSMGLLGISIGLYFLCTVLFFNRKATLEILLLIIFLADVTILQKLDVTLPVYFLFSALPLLPFVREISARTEQIVVIFAAYLLFGLMFQSVSGTIQMFVSRCWQLIVFFLVAENGIGGDEKPGNFLLTVGLLTEAAIAGWLFVSQLGRSTIRLTAGAQPVSGNMTVALLPLAGWLYFSETRPEQQSRTVLLCSLCGIMTALSGTRGYLVVFGLCMLWVYGDYYLTGRLKKAQNVRGRISVLFLGIVSASAYILFIPGVIESITGVLRLEEDVGVRTFENAAVMDYLSHAPFLNVLAGLGLGSRPGTVPAFANAIRTQTAQGMWGEETYLNGTGALFHNLAANVSVTMGLFGIVLFAYCFYRVWMILSGLKDRRCRRFFQTFLIGFMIMNWFRWSTDCGIAVMIMLALSYNRCRAAEKGP